MSRNWRSESWKATHPLSSPDKIKNAFHDFINPFRKILGKLTLSEPTKYIDLAAQWNIWQNIEGDYCEFGVYTGRQFIHAYKAITKISKEARFYAFDSFEGLPKPEGVDLVYPQFAEGGLAATRKEFIKNLRKYNVDLSKVEVVVGWYSNVLKASLPEKIGLSKIAVALIDCDLYASTIPVLDFLTNLLVDGGIIIFDDWYLFRGHPDLGPQRAFREWQARVPEFQFSLLPAVPNSFQKAFIVHKPLTPALEEHNENCN